MVGKRSRYRRAHGVCMRSLILADLMLRSVPNTSDVHFNNIKYGVECTFYTASFE